MRIELTPVQEKALSLLQSDATYVLLYGGSRSGKTRLIVERIWRMCIKHPGLRVLVARQVYSHAISTLWNQTFVDVAKTYYTAYPDKSLFAFKQGEHIVRFINGSEIVLAGLDDKERLEKILGGEYGIIYLNECSMIKYQAITMVKTRLAQNIPNMKNKLLLDENPPSPTHWSYKMFILHQEPKSGDSLDKNEYVSMLLNPKDNIENLPDDYINTLESLPDRDKRRFLYGEFVKVEGAIYDDFNINIHSIDINDIPPFEYFTVGIDSNGNNLAAILIGWSGSSVYLLDEYTAYRQIITEFDATLQYKWRQYNYIAYADPAGAVLNEYIFNCVNADNAVSPGINAIREKIVAKEFFVVTKTLDNGTKVPMVPQTIAEMDSYRYDDKGRIIKDNDHLMDALRYSIYSHLKYGASILI